MKNKKIYSLFVSLALVLLTACTADDISTPEPTPQPSDDAVITIYGGRPALGATRAVNKPALPGICQADKMQIWAYTDVGEHYSWQSPSDLTLSKTFDEITVTNTKQTTDGSVDRWAKQDYTYGFRRAVGTIHGNHFAIPALAYTNTDKPKFSTNTGSNYTALSLSLTAAALAASPMITPELFFGRLRFMSTDSRLTSYWGSDGGRWNEYGYFYYLNQGTSGTDDITNHLSGHLYRIVSQINVNITEVPTDLVDYLQLYMTNVPKAITLYGTHGNIYTTDNGNTDDIGRFYPVTAVTSTSNCIDGQTLVATTNVFTNDEAHMSAFFLPSEVGGELTLRVHYKPGAMKDALNNDITQRDYPIHPGKSAFLTGDDADVYNVGAALQNGSDLYVYNTTLNKFYSYANVRVNISGKYDNVAAEDQDVTLTIEVEPGYERGHTININ